VSASSRRAAQGRQLETTLAQNDKVTYRWHSYFGSPQIRGESTDVECASSDAHVGVRTPHSHQSEESRYFFGMALERILQGKQFLYSSYLVLLNRIRITLLYYRIPALSTRFSLLTQEI
jgi:hypothetical protein